jgi:hypothetical protein
VKELRLVWIADWDFAQLNLLQFLTELRVDSGIRVDAHTKITWQGRKLLVSFLRVKLGQLLWLEGVIHRLEGRPFEGRQHPGELADSLEVAQGALEEGSRAVVCGGHFEREDLLS